MKTKTIIWVKQRIIEEANKFECRRAFRLHSNGAYQAASRNKILDEVCRHMPDIKRHRRRTTKAGAICALANKNPGWTTTQIAKEVGCRPEYVRVALRQRAGTGRSDIDMRYVNSSLGKLSRKRTNDRTGEARRAYYRELATTKSLEKARQKYKQVNERCGG